MSEDARQRLRAGMTGYPFDGAYVGTRRTGRDSLSPIVVYPPNADVPAQ